MLPALLLPVLLLGAPMVEPPTPAELHIPRQQRFDLRDYGGKGDGATLNTDAFEAAVAAIQARCACVAARALEP